ncbi:translation initiation factor IF-2 and translation elongation factor Tu domain protein [Metarhizium robertsii]|uniref:Translation initiation factor IF-2, mitochondrial n=2 Tax=Metarhizium robertsii TaxID=568076 RepID=E9EWY2_METRA|nr:mitochondrial translation initiation factor 2 [Metarhizium robertsii ARSEF 23]EFY99602.2 mitochondrial translation initiation factor 2 [Metarhizium robertsii ARSEF 23]EXV06279.1 translation initiation factor IF-2 and translation elongation factor Tu domain protein [Metarhizium robertsii]
MLRARAWKGRGHPFACTYCRAQLSSTTSQTHQALWSAQGPCTTTTATRHNSNTGRSAPSNGGFPGGFAGSVAGSWGAFAANKPARTLDSNDSPGGSLLPHELEARSRMKGPRTKSNTNNNEANRELDKVGSPLTRPKNRSRTHDARQAQATKSKSVLADVFKTMREPKMPPTPKSWSAAGQQGGSGQTTRFAPETPTVTFSPNPSATTSQTAHRRAPPPEPSMHPAGGAPRQIGWGSFSHRKQQVPAHGHSHGNDSTTWSEITRSARAKPRSHQRQKTANPSSTAATSKGGPEVIAPEQDFWGELDTRVAGFREVKGKGRRESAEADGLGKRPIDKAPSSDGDGAGHNQSVASSHQVHDKARERERRKSRFDIEDEPASDDRRTKKSRKSARGRRVELDEDWDDESSRRWEHKQRRKAEKEAQKERELHEENPAMPIFLPEYISVSNLAQALKQRPDQFLVDMEEMGFENVTPDTIMTGETAALISMEYGFDPTVDTGSQRDLKPRPIPDDVSSLPSRPPVVTIMGHVDHGKTTLLDWLRKSSVAAQEHGGITQHIGAFVVKMSTGKHITFLDTPGHAAFLSMRQRGANVTDIVVLVVAADDSVMPQTIEALKHATSAKVPIIVAINKVDKEDARIDQVKADLARHGVEIEDYGGDVQVVCVSGKTGQGMPDLEESIITLSEILDVRAETDGMAEGWILESSVKQNGKAATVLVKRGTLRPGDFVVAGKTWARVRVLRNEAGAELVEAAPGTPVEVLGWRELPDAGEQVLQAPDEGKAKTAVQYRLEMAEREQSSVQLAEQEQRQRDKAAAEDKAEEDGDAHAASEPGILYQNFTVRADVVGSVEAVCGSVLELGNNEVRPKILRSAAGQISEYDIDHAAASKSVIVNFNVPILPHIKQRAEEAKVRILDHNVIYHVVDDAKAVLSELLPINITYRVSGEADILQVFPINLKKRVFKNIAGCRVRNGSIKKSSLVKVLRKGKVIFDGNIDTLKHVKKDVMEMGKGTECGIGLEGFEDFEVDDQIQTYEEVRERRIL